jgi:hypothetical protein
MYTTLRIDFWVQQLTTTSSAVEGEARVTAAAKTARQVFTVLTARTVDTLVDVWGKEQ